MRVPRVRVIALAVTLFLVVLGFIMQIQIGRANLSFDYLKLADVRAAKYVDLHLDKNAVVMAGHPDIVYHYCKRRVVWFPPISNPQVLMDGIQKHKVNFIVVIHRNVEYWLPPEHDCFKGLSEAYPGAFRLAYDDPSFNIYEVSNNARVSTGHS